MSSSKGARLLLALGVLGPLAVGAGAAGGCSSDEPKAAASTDGGADATPDASRAAPPEPEAGTPKSCRELCADKHPGAVAKDEAIDTCWQTHCASPCIEGNAVPSDAGADGGDDAGADAGACVSPVVTDTPSCDQCTTAFCCASWDGCFQDPECSALEACYQQCVE